MKRITILMIMIVLSVAFVLFAQEATGEDEAVNQTSETITDYPIDNFEFANTWVGSMPRDLGVISLMKQEGGPADVVASDAEANKYILGAKIEYFRSGHPWFSISPPRPIKIPGLTKELSVWVAGRNHNNKLSFYVQDILGNTHEVGNEPLNYIGWKNISVSIPVNVIQDATKNQFEEGISFMGIHIDVDSRDSFGKYYIYFDNLLAKVDENYFKAYKDEDDPKDTW